MVGQLASEKTLRSIPEFPPLLVRQDHGGFNLAFGDAPILFEQPGLLQWLNHLKAVFFIKADRPDSVRPRADQDRTARQLPQMRQQARANPRLLAAGANIGVPDEGHVLDRLNAHYAHQGPGLLVAPEHNAFVDFMPQFLPGHVWLCPAIRRDGPFICIRAIVDDGPNQLKITVVTAADHEYSVSWPGISRFILAGQMIILVAQKSEILPRGSRFLVPSPTRQIDPLASVSAIDLDFPARFVCYNSRSITTVFPVGYERYYVHFYGIY